MHCHSTEGPSWNAIKDHASILDRVRAGTVSCASSGCHGPAHPFSKPDAQRAEAGPPDDKKSTLPEGTR